jgi:hypothetical protein
MNPFKQHPYLVAVFALLFIILFLFSLSYCGGKETAKMDARDIIIEQNNEEIKRLESALDLAQDKTIKAIEKSNETQQKLEIKIYQYDQLRKKKIVIPTRNTDVYDDSLVRIWTNQNKE